MSALARASKRLRGWLANLSVSQLLALTIGVLFGLAVVGIGLALIAASELGSARALLLNEVGPSLRSSLKLENALVNQETGVRGYLITANPEFLQPYHSGLANETLAYADLRSREKAVGPDVAAKVEDVHARARRWRAEFVAPVLARPHPPSGASVLVSVKGKRLFDEVRASLARLQAALTRKDTKTRSELNKAASSLDFLLVFAGILILGGVLGAGLVLRRTITRPLARLGSEARRVADGQFQSPLAIAHGPREVAEVGAEIEAMRRRIVEELASVEAAREKVEEQAKELTRSNAELEQFAYVASHDLQEPLRKVASFCQALQTRYQGQLDARADQYIDFAVDGAKRMQTLINDLLAFSRVGRSGRQPELLDLGEVLAAAQTALSARLRETDAKVVSGPLPTVRGDRALLTSLFQNLIANSVKFRGGQAPQLHVDAQRDGDEWELSLADNGIGIEQEYAERIFLIFQRLHSRESFDGSGIGLAMCRKIVEHHGGRIWLDTSYGEGACFRFTLPIAKESQG